MIHQDLSRFKSFHFWILRWKVNWTLTSSRIFIFYQKFSIQSLFWREFNSLQSHVSQALAENALFGRYKSRHYKSFWKVNKSHLFQKSTQGAWKIILTWDHKHWLEDSSRFPKSPQAWKNMEVWRNGMVHKFTYFQEMHKEK